MADVLSSAQRSFNMSQIRSEKTGPEMLLGDLLTSNDLGDFVMHSKDIPGHPDFYYPDRQAVVFMDGCFWHGCKKCYQEPDNNKKKWKAKIESNIKRDETVNKELKRMGIKVIRVKEHELKKNPEKVLKKIHLSLPEDNRPKVLDLFAGAGGLSEGFIKAGCEIVGHIEMDKNSCSTLTTRMIYHALVKRGKIDEYKNYVLGKVTREELVEKYNLQKERDSVICAKIGEDNYRDLIAEIKKRLGGKQLDLIVGGPPCQAYSLIGRARDTNHMRKDDRNYLYRYYVKFLKVLKPKIFVFENVPGLKTAGGGKYLRSMRKLMKKVGYDTDYKILNAADYGVPQCRRRVILVGWNKKSKITSYPDFKLVDRKYLVSDFLADLPKIQAGEGSTVCNYAKDNKVLKRLGIINPDFNLVISHVTRPHSAQDLEIYRMAVQAKQNGQNLKYNDLPKRLKTHNNEKGFLDRFKVVDQNARGSQTVVAHIHKDGHYYIHPDINQNRSLSVREAARLQSFPDDYKFEGSRGPQFKQIGNAVPPILSAIIAEELVKYIK